MTLAAAPTTALWVIGAYMLLLVGLGLLSQRFFRGTAADYFVATRSIGPVLLLMSVFGTTMTAFALVGSTGKAYEQGVGVYGLMASTSGVVHSLVFFLVGIRLWAIGKRHDFVTQIQFFRARFESNALGWLLFPVLVALIVPYLLLGLLGAGSVVRGVTLGMFPDLFPGVLNPETGARMFVGGVPPWVTGLAICGVVLFYVFLGGVRSAAWANTFQTIVFMLTGVFTFLLIAEALGGVRAASAAALEKAPELLSRAAKIGHGEFLSYAFVPLSVGMFPHLFQHWLTARSARTFRLTTVAHPIFIMIVWVPCILIGVWAAGAGIEAPGGNVNAILARMVAALVDSPLVTGVLTAGILAAIMSSLDSQFVCLGTMFSHDVVMHHFGKERFSDAQKVFLGRVFIVAVVAATYAFSLFPPPSIFDLGVWCFSGFASLFPLVFAAVYWRRATRAGAIASVLVMAATWAFFFFRGLVAPTLAGTPHRGEYLVAGVMPVTFIFLAAAAALVLVSLATKPPPRHVVERFIAPAREDVRASG